MANYFIFGIGGTGSRVIRSFTMLMAAGFMPFKADDRIFPILIDYDTENGDTLRTKELIDLYQDIHDAAYPPELRNEEKDYGNLYFSTPIMKMCQMGDAYKSGFAMKFGVDNDQTFEQWTASDALTGSKRRTQDLMNSLYDDSSDADSAEMKLNMKIGFKGNPNIGSIVFHSLKDTPEFNDFTSLCQEGDRVILVGSLFGGTGSAGIPEMVQAIRTSALPNVSKVNLSVVMVCPYFGFRTSEEKAVRSSIFNSKTKAALNFYKGSGINEMINSVYWVGDDKTSNYDYSEGAQTQRNAIHIVDLISALSICHFAETPAGHYDPAEKKVAGGAKYFKYNIAEEVSQNSGAVDGQPKHTLSYTNFIESELEHVFYPLASFGLALRFFHDDVERGTDAVRQLDWYVSRGERILRIKDCFDGNNRPLPPTTDNTITNDLRTVCGGLDKFYDLFKEWNEEFKKHTVHALYLFNFDGELHDYIVDGSMLVDTKKLGLLKGTKTLLDTEEDVAEGTKESFRNIKAVTPEGVKSDCKAYMFMRLLTEGSRMVFEAGKLSDRSDDRRNHLSSNTKKPPVTTTPPPQN